MEFFVGLFFHVLIGLFNNGREVQARIRGIPGVDYPNHYVIPVTSFNCLEQDYIPGLYADLETGCQVFHYCYEHRKESFLCPPGTIFNQPILACDHWYSSNCSLAPIYYNVNGNNQDRPHNIPIVVKLQPDSSNEISDSAESLFQKMSSLYSTNSQFSASGQSEDYFNLEDRLGDAELQQVDHANRKGRSMDSSDFSDAVDDSSFVGYEGSNLHSFDHEVSNENSNMPVTEYNAHRFNPFRTPYKKFYPKVSENFEPKQNPYTEYKASASGSVVDDEDDNYESIHSNTDETILNSEGAKVVTEFGSFHKRLSEVEIPPKRSRRKPLYIVPDEIVEPKVPSKTQRTRSHLYVEPTDISVTTDIAPEPLTTLENILNSQPEFAFDSEESEETMELPTEVPNILDVDHSLNELEDSSFLSEFEGHFQTSTSDLEYLEQESLATEALIDQSLVTESSVNPEPVAVLQDERNANFDIDRMISDEITQEDVDAYYASLNRQDISSEETDNYDSWIQNEESDSRSIREELVESSDYEENYPSYQFGDYLYQPESEVYSDNPNTVDEWNPEFPPYFTNEEQGNMYAYPNTDYRANVPSNAYESSLYQPVYGELQTLNNLQYNVQSETLGNRFIPGFSMNREVDMPKFIRQNPQYYQNENVYHSSVEGQDENFPYYVPSDKIDSVQRPSHHILDDHSQYVYTLSDGSNYNYNQPLDTENYSETEVDRNFGEDIHLSRTTEDYGVAESHLEFPYRRVLPSVDYVMPEGEHVSDKDQNILEQLQGPQVESQHAEEHLELNKENTKESNRYPRQIEKLLKNWERIYLKSLEDYLRKTRKEFSSSEKVEFLEERDGDLLLESKIPEEVRRQLARDAWKKLDLTATTLCEVGSDDIPFSHLLTGKEITPEIREEIKREALKAIYSRCLPELEDDDEFKEFSDDYVDFFNSQKNPETDEDIDYTESEIVAQNKDWEPPTGNFSFHKIGDEALEAKLVPSHSDYILQKSVQRDSLHDLVFGNNKEPQMLYPEYITEVGTSENLEVESSSQYITELPKDLDQDIFNLLAGNLEISESSVFEKSLTSSDHEQKHFGTNFVPSEIRNTDEAFDPSDPKQGSDVTKSPLEFEASKSTTLPPPSEQNLKPISKPKTGKSVPKESKIPGGSAVQFLNEAELLNQLVIGNSKDLASQSYGNFPLELQQQHYNSLPSSIQQLIASQAFSRGKPGAKVGGSRSSLPRKILSMKSQKLNLLKKYLNAIKNQR